MRRECRWVEKRPGSGENSRREVGRDEESNFIFTGILLVHGYMLLAAKGHLRSNHEEADVGSWTPVHCVDLFVK